MPEAPAADAEGEAGLSIASASGLLDLLPLNPTRAFSPRSFLARALRPSPPTPRCSYSHLGWLRHLSQANCCDSAPR